MNNNSLLTYLNKAKIFIVVASIVGSLFVYNYANNKQSYRASTVIEYVSENAADGKSPNGKSIDVSKIYSSKVVSMAIKDLNLQNSNNIEEDIRSNISVEPIIPDDEILRKESAIKNNDEYSYFPTKYIVSYTDSVSGNSEFSRTILDSIIENYIAYYSEEYVDAQVVPDMSNYIETSDYDYLEHIELLESNVSSIVEYLEQKDYFFKNYRSATTGYSFGDLLSYYTYLEYYKIPSLYADVLEGGYYKDKELLKDKYRTRIEDNNIEINTYDSKISKVKILMDAYAAKIKESVIPSKDNPEESNLDYILKDVYGENYESKDNETTYDNLILTYVDLTCKKNEALVRNEYYKYILLFCNEEKVDKDKALLELETNISKISEETLNKDDIIDTDDVITKAISDIQKRIENEDAKENAVSEAELANSITELSDDLSSEYKLLEATAKENLLYQGSSIIAIRSSITVARSINVKLYTIVSAFLFMILGSFIAVVVGKIKDVAAQN